MNASLQQLIKNMLKHAENTSGDITPTPTHHHPSSLFPGWVIVVYFHKISFSLVP